LTSLTIDDQTLFYFSREMALFVLADLIAVVGLNTLNIKSQVFGHKNR
jgi:hypothetical protein